MPKLSLKTQNVVPLSMLIVFQCALAYALSAGDMNALSEKIITPKSPLILLIGVLAGWLSYMVPTGVKNSMVFLRLKHALPGHRFIQLSERDPRIDEQNLRATIPEYLALKADYKNQNRYWYNQIYRPIVDDREVSSSHKSYLLYRDAASVSVTLIVCLLIASQFLPMIKGVLTTGFVSVMAACSVGFVVAANIAGKRFVATTVAIYLASPVTVKNVSTSSD